MRIVKSASLILLIALLGSSGRAAQSVRRWDFDQSGDQQSWTVPEPNRGVVMGGSLWLTLEPKETNPAMMATTAYQTFGDPASDPKVFASSPAGLNIPAAESTQVRLRVLNLSSLTDFFLRWRTTERGWGDEKNATGWGQPSQSRRCTLKSDVKEWQDITCYIDGRWQGTVDQIELISAHRFLRGNLWIDWIEIAKGSPESVQARPDVASERVVPRILVPGLSQSGFAQAFKVLDECLTTDTPIYGFNYPVMTPGGYYTNGGWWQLDSSLALTGAKWANQQFAENVVRGFAELQAENPDGRIDLMGQHGVRGQVADVSSLPAFFEAAYDAARRTQDESLREQIYNSMRRYLDWWLSPVKRDVRTGLVSAVFEETFGDRSQGSHIAGSKLDDSMTLAPVDLNVLVAVGAAHTAELAAALNKPQDASRYHQAFLDLSQAINTYLWDDNQGAYYNYDLHTHERRAGLNVATFDSLRLGIAPASRRDRLLEHLLDPVQFNWGKRPLTSWAMTEPGFVEAPGDYDGRAWFGNIWTLRNMAVVAGLEESQRPDLAAELNWATIKTFHANYREYALPSTGKGQGATDYAWTASQYIGAVIEHLFGVDYDAIEKRLRIAPHVPKTLYGKEIAIDNLILPASVGTRLTLRIRQSSPTAATIDGRIIGLVPDIEVAVVLPTTGEERRARLQQSFSEEFH